MWGRVQIGTNCNAGLDDKVQVRDESVEEAPSVVGTGKNRAQNDGEMRAGRTARPRRTQVEEEEEAEE